MSRYDVVVLIIIITAFPVLLILLIECFDKVMSWWAKKESNRKAEREWKDRFQNSLPQWDNYVYPVYPANAYYNLYNYMDYGNEATTNNPYHPDFWECPYCGQANDYPDTSCQYCGGRRLLSPWIGK